MSSSGHTDPALDCDLVMKGGITSGVIYPRLVKRLADVYRLRSIGGTSAGAIAAGAAAAAQLGVAAKSNPTAFDELDSLPETLGQPAAGGGGSSMLLGLFQPQRPLRHIFRLLLTALDSKTPKALAFGLTRTLIVTHPIGALVGALPGVLVLGESWGLASIVGLLLALLGAVLGATIAALIVFGRDLPSNGFGICNGMPGGEVQAPALTPWLDGYLNHLAGKTGSAPLTFGELWAGRLRDGNGDLPPAGANPSPPKVIELAMMTTAVSIGRPFRLPFEAGNLYFDPRELAQLFPTDVVRWMERHARDSLIAKDISTPERQLLALPEPQDFPVIVAVRMSLSFPILLSAVPLYTVDFTLKENQSPHGTPKHATRVLFSDGGISSNFPIHFFDSPLPTRPTFGVNLTDFHPDVAALPPDQRDQQRVFLPGKIANRQGIARYCPELSEKPGLGSVVGFVAAIVGTMQRWRDETQLGMPGFRDRIADISHLPSEGGMNLNMDPQVIALLAGSGRDAADLFIQTFATGGGPTDPNGWDNHERIRLRTLLSQLQQAIDRIQTVISRGNSPYLAIAADQHPPSYPLSATNAQQAVAALQALANLAATLQQAGADFSDGVPRPEPELRIVPRI